MASFAAADYQIFVRNSSLQYVGQIDRYDSLTYIKRFNAVGSFTLQLSITHPMASYLQLPGYGIVVVRTPAGSTPTIDFSGPVRYTERHGQADNTLIVSGVDDLVWIAARLAYPVLAYPYFTNTLADSPLRFYPFSETSGTVALDGALVPHNGTYGGTVTLNQPSLIDDDHTAVLLGSNGYVSVPTTGLPTGNAAFSLECWFYYSGAPSSTAVLGFLGTVAAGNCAYMGILTSGKPTMQLKGTNYSGATALTVGYHMMQLIYNGSAAGLYIDNAQVATGSPAAGTITYGAASFGCIGAGASNFAQTTIQFGAIYNFALSISQINAHTNTGFSIFSTGAYDAGSGSSEAVIKHFVDTNAGPDAITARVTPNLTIETNSNRGTASVAFSARFEQLLQADGNGLIQLLARTSVPELGFRVQTVAGGLQFQVYVPNDKTASVIFSAELGNLGNYVYINDFQHIVNYIVAGGGGTGTGRAFVNGQNASSVSTYGRFESFVDHRSSAATTTELTTEVNNALAQGQNKPTFNGTLLDTSAIQYGRDYNLGDKVSIVVDGTLVLTDIIREVQVALDPIKGEVITPAVGTPNNGQIVNAFMALNQIGKHIRALGTRVAQLERAT